MPLELELCPGRWVGGQHPCFIIAEIGQNHQGDLDVAKRMIRMAKVRGLSRVLGRRAGGGAWGRPAWARVGQGCAELGPSFLCLSVPYVRPAVQLAGSISKRFESSSALRHHPDLFALLHLRPPPLLPALSLPSGGRMIFLKHRFDRPPGTFSGFPLPAGRVETL